jgi:hypothetical protein
MAGSLKTVASGLAEYTLDLVAVQDIRWNNGNSETAKDYTFFFVNDIDNHHLEASF